MSYLGAQLSVVAVAVEVYGLTGSSLAVGLVGGAQLVPLLGGTLLGGRLADAGDLRRLLLRVQLLLALTSGLLALNAAVGDTVWPLVLLTAAAAGLSGVDRTARSALFPSLVEPDQLPAAHAIWQLHQQSGNLLGPALAGLLLTATGPAVVFGLDALSYLLAALAVLRLPSGGGANVRPRRDSAPSLLEGLRFVRREQRVRTVLLLDLDATVLGFPYAVFPAFAVEVLDGGPGTVGLLFAAPGFGALGATLVSGWLSRVARRERAGGLAIAVWGLAIAAFGFTSWLPLALTLLALGGAALVVASVLRSSSIHAAAPETLRGRVAAVHIAVASGGPRLGDLRAGSVAALASP